MYKLKKMVVLVGLMGAGKSSIGNQLSDFLNVGFIDADNEIEKAAGMTIVEIFEKWINILSFFILILCFNFFISLLRKIKLYIICTI